MSACARSMATVTTSLGPLVYNEDRGEDGRLYSGCQPIPLTLALSPPVVESLEALLSAACASRAGRALAWKAIIHREIAVEVVR